MSRCSVPIAAAWARPWTIWRVVDGSGDGQGAVLGHQVRECATGHQHHGDDRYPVDLVAAEDVDGVWMAERGGDAALAHKSRAIRVAREPGGERLGPSPFVSLRVSGCEVRWHPRAECSRTA